MYKIITCTQHIHQISFFKFNKIRPGQFGERNSAYKCNLNPLGVGRIYVHSSSCSLSTNLNITVHYCDATCTPRHTVEMIVN